MNIISRTITGIIAIVFGLVLTILSFFIYGIPLIIIGVVILLNKKEDDIEKIKIQRRKK